MPFAHGAKAQNESAAMLGGAALVWVAHDTWVEEGRSLERVLV